MNADSIRTKAHDAGHMPQLDSLRAFAVFAVFMYHFLQWPNLDRGAIAGVRLFFVLSGFLITGILLRSRDLRDKTGQDWKFAVRQFYARRFLRIFPLYYFIVAVALVINLGEARRIYPWLLTYTLNFHMAAQGWFVEYFAHLWTLAVEEQFYIAWPWFILFAPRKVLIPATLGLVVSAPFFRFYAMTQGLHGLYASIFPLACLDTLGMGALLALLSHDPSLHELRSRLAKIALPAGLVGTFLLITLSKQIDIGTLFMTFFDFSLALVFFWLIDAAGRGFKGPVGKILEWDVLQYLGKISYGLYVYHEFMPHLCRSLFDLAGFTYPESMLVRFILQTAAAVAVSALSWRLMEKPLNDMKRYFRYDGAPRGKDALSAAASESGIPPVVLPPKGRGGASA